jgi:ABC-type sugar transport system ATPase subunit
MVLRQGRNVGERLVPETTMDEIVGLIVGAKEDAPDSIRRVASGV